jgi:uridine phosphorylase
VDADVLMVMIHSQLDHLVAASTAAPVRFSEMHLYGLYRVLEGSGRPVALSGPFIGAPHAVIALEKLIVLGAKRIWVLGWCGSLQPGLGVGHLIVPTEAVSEEGTSPHYPIGDRSLRSDTELNRWLADGVAAEGLPVSSGPVWTTDAIYRETPSKVRAYGEQGVLAVEMEMSALMAVAAYRGVRLTGLLVVSDELFDLKWRPGFSSPLLQERSRAAASMLLRLAASFDNNAGDGADKPP